jgi:hypothetical protein
VLSDGLGGVSPAPTFERTTTDKATLLRKMNEAMDEVLVEAAASMMRHKLARLARRKPKVFALVSIGYGWILEMEEQSDDKQRDAENEVPGGTLV